MTPEEIENLANAELSSCDGRDYYAYRDDPHWYGEKEEILRFAAAIEAATIDQIAQWYEKQGWFLDEGDIADAIRALATKEGT